MTLLLLAGVWAIAFGHIALTNKIKMKDGEARMFGIIALILAAHALPQATEFLSGYMPGFISENETFSAAFGALIGAGMLYVAAWITQVGLPKLKLPGISISVKK